MASKNSKISKSTKAHKKTNKGKEVVNSLVFHYIKTPCYRSYHVDGIFGGLTPSGDLYMELFIERQSTPLTVTHVISENGFLEDEIDRTGKSGMVREVEAGAIMNIETAKVLKKWLSQKIEEHEKRKVESEEVAK